VAGIRRCGLKKQTHGEETGKVVSSDRGLGAFRQTNVHLPGLPPAGHDKRCRNTQGVSFYGYLYSFDRMIFQQTGKQDNAGRFEHGYLKVTTKNLPIGLCPDAKSLRKPMNRGALMTLSRRPIQVVYSPSGFFAELPPADGSRNEEKSSGFAGSNSGIPGRRRFASSGTLSRMPCTTHFASSNPP